jgi:LysR family transcriptional regulator, hydrogen peroxide-inducible genes activator
MLNLDIHHIRYFLAVCETLNFTKAAENSNVSQPALSRAIQQLEEEVGGLLFRRERSLTHLTDLGHLLRPHFQQVIDELGDVRRAAKRFLTMEDANFSLDVMCTIGPTRFTGLLGNFRSVFPGISLSLVEGTPKKLAERLENGGIDIAIMAQAEVVPGRFDILPLYSERFLVIFPASHRFAAQNAVAMADMDGENYLERLNCEYASHMESAMRDRQCRVNTIHRSEREDWIQNMVAGGLGISTMPEFSVGSPGLQASPMVEPEVWREICLVSMAGRRHSPAVASFVKTLRSFQFTDSRFAPRQQKTAHPS